MPLRAAARVRVRAAPISVLSQNSLDNSAKPEKL
jgi:hypothetical protein